MNELEDKLAQKVQALSDLELGVLISLVADQHCIIEAENSLINDIGQELQLVMCTFLEMVDGILIAVDCF